MAYSITEKNRIKIKQLYLDGNSSHEIKDLLELEVTPRSIQRIIKKWGISRSQKESFALAMKKGRVKFKTKKRNKRRTTLKVGARMKILSRDNYHCVLCGATAATTELEVDHIDNNPRNNKEENLRTLCHECNTGRPSPHRVGSLASGL